MTKASSKRIATGYEPIAGYVLEELIGRGGFGEVWRAEAPGGIKKAVKFVYGDRDEHRAEQELKSLERIKGVQHPFILTLERFEIVDDQLVIVTELADGSLDEVFELRRKQGSCGIARKALLSYMRDTADALDYLHELYKLQHLDIKPANLLVVGGRIKVADFGLLKDLGDDVEHSIVGGLTPIYAPPELFDGRPSMHTDQYSLAVMYQELLTGTRPFSGRTIAQLATQHIHNAPNLKPLPPSDRPVVARALEKSPDRRFRSCSEFVDALLHEQDAASRSTIAAPLTSVDEFEKQSEVQDLPELTGAGNESKAGVGQALVVGLGGTGADCIAELRRRVVELRSLSPLVLYSVSIDVDARSAMKFDDDIYSDRLPHHACITTPLRAAIEYRNRGTEHLKSISRRWIYNIPKSGATEGMRPLGRLALIDHADNVTKGLRAAISELRDHAGPTTPNVYVVGSLAGGSGSGMFVDVAHLLRFLLDEAGLHDVEILSLLSTARMQGDPSRPLTLHDTKAALQEIKHFLRPGNGYPGDDGAQWQSVPAARTPLHTTYLIAASQVPRASSPTETIVDYLWIDATNAGKILDAARQLNHAQQDSNSATPALRSVGIVQLSGTRRLEENVLAPATARHLLRRWLGDPDRAPELAASLVQRVSRQNNLSPEVLRAHIAKQYGHDQESRRSQLTKLLNSLPQQVLYDSGRLEQSLSEIINSTLAAADDYDVDGVIVSLEREMAIRLGDCRLDFASAIETARMYRAEIQSTAKQLTVDAEAVIDLSADDAAELPSKIRVAERILTRLASRAAARQAQRIQDRLGLLEQTLSFRAMTLAKAIRAVSGDRKGAANAWDQMDPTLRDQFDSVIAELHRICAPDWLVKLIGVGGGSMKPEQIVAEVMEAAIPLVCRAVVTSVAKGKDESDFEVANGTEHATANVFSLSGRNQTPDSAESVGATATLTNLAPDYGGTETTAPVLTIEEAVSAVRPALLACGGYQRLILVVGSKAEQEVLEPQVQQYHSGKLTTAIIDSAPPMLIHEAERIVIDDVVKRLTALSGGDDRISRRLLSRNDVDWMID